MTSGSSLLINQQLISVRPYKDKDEYLYAMKEDLAEWLGGVHQINIAAETFFESLENGVILCRHGNMVNEYIRREKTSCLSLTGSSRRCTELHDQPAAVLFKDDCRPGTFVARDNIANFIAWCRQVLRVPETLIFETEDLVLRKNEKNVILCLLEMARRGSRYGAPIPKLVELEQEIDNEAEMSISKTRTKNNPVAQFSASGKRWTPFIETDLQSLDEMVRDILQRCTCPNQFPMVKVSEGKYKFGNELTLIYVRILRYHVMVRIGGGWDTLENYLDRHDPCRCSTAHKGRRTNYYKDSSSTEVKSSSEDISKASTKPQQQSNSSSGEVHEKKPANEQLDRVDCSTSDVTSNTKCPVPDRGKQCTAKNISSNYPDKIMVLRSKAGKHSIEPYKTPKSQKSTQELFDTKKESAKKRMRSPSPFLAHDGLGADSNRSTPSRKCRDPRKQKVSTQRRCRSQDTVNTLDDTRDSRPSPTRLVSGKRHLAPSQNRVIRNTRHPGLTPTKSDSTAKSTSTTSSPERGNIPASELEVLEVQIRATLKALSITPRRDHRGEHSRSRIPKPVSCSIGDNDRDTHTGCLKRCDSGVDISSNALLE